MEKQIMLWKKFFTDIFILELVFWLEICVPVHTCTNKFNAYEYICDFCINYGRML